jgi:hypothetical protein
MGTAVNGHPPSIKGESMVGIPYGYVNFDGSVTCPSCGQHIKEQYDKDGEKLTHHYADHWVKNHEGNIDKKHKPL